MTEGSAVWRIINSPAADGATNMAIDESILEAVRQGNRPRRSGCTPGSRPAFP